MRTDLKGLPVLVTGADGFIGSHLVERLIAESADVRALCHYNSHGSLGWLDSLPRQQRTEIDIRLGDVRDPGLVRALVADRAIVLHLAALIAIPYSYIAPRSFVETNVLGTQNLLDAVRSEGCRMVNTSTSEVYGTPDEVPIRETHALKGQSPYAASKIAADKLCEAYALSFGVQVATLRPFNTYGPRQSLRAVIPTVLAQLLAGRDTVRLGSVEPRRDFTYISDTVEGFVRSIQEPLDPGEVVQLGSGVAISIGEVVELCQRVVGTEARIETDAERVRPERSEVKILLSDPGNAQRRLRWSCRIGLEEGLARTAAWLADHPLDPWLTGQYHR
jgi:NAD dependent epimerase/dehydratase